MICLGVSILTVKGNNTLKFIKRNIQTFNSKNKETAYKNICQTSFRIFILNLGPLPEKYIHQLEMVKHRAVRYILNNYAFTSSVKEMLDKIDLPTLESCRKIASLVMLYKIHTGQVRSSLPPYITPSLRNMFSIPYSIINAHMNSFFPATARLWNNPACPPPPRPPTLSATQTWKNGWLGLLYTLSKVKKKQWSGTYTVRSHS